MTIQEAIKTGKPFHRGWHNGWIYADDDGELYWDELPNGYVPDVKDILADDWEVKQ